jgi:hypothetical protein
MEKKEDAKSVTRRDVLKLAGTAAAFCTSFGFAHASQTGVASVQSKHLQARWQQAEIRWYKGSELLYSEALPSKVMKHLEADETATIEVKLYRAGRLHQNLGKIEVSH